MRQKLKNVNQTWEMISFNRLIFHCPSASSRLRRVSLWDQFVLILTPMSTPLIPEASRWDRFLLLSSTPSASISPTLSPWAGAAHPSLSSSHFSLLCCCIGDKHNAWDTPCWSDPLHAYFKAPAL